MSSMPPMLHIKESHSASTSTLIELALLLVSAQSSMNGKEPGKVVFPDSSEWPWILARGKVVDETIREWAQ
jgi:hypothetical protein